MANPRRRNFLKPRFQTADLNAVMTWTEFAAYLGIVLAIFSGSVSFILYRLWWR